MNMGLALAKEIKEKIDKGELPAPADLRKFNALLNRYGLPPINTKVGK